MNKTKVLFIIHDLGQGGAEKVLVNLVNHLNRSKFEITVMSLFGGGVNEQFLKPDVHYKAIYPRPILGNSKWMKLFSPKQLHNKYIKEHYDIEVSYLEGPCARVISGCQNRNTKLVSWIHTKYIAKKDISSSFRNFNEALACYNRFDYIACVSEDVRVAFCDFLDFQKPNGVLYNTIESDTIKLLSEEECDIVFEDEAINIISVGSLKPIKRYDRLLNIAKQLKREGYHAHFYFLGDGSLKSDFNQFIISNDLSDYVTLLGYRTNPYKYIKKCDLFVCSSQTEGFSTATTEALIVGTPVCTTDVSGMKELLGENNEYGLVTQNSEESLCKGIKSLLVNRKQLEDYRVKALERSRMFSMSNTVKAVEDLLLSV